MSDTTPGQPGRVAIVTGAGSGVGRATALALADAGWTPTLVGRREQPLAETADSIESRDGRCLVTPADIADEAAVADVAARTLANLGRIDALVNVAGVGIFGPVESYPLADWQQTLATNLTGVFLCCRAVLPAMRERGEGAILAIASGAGKQGYANLSAYAASKFGLIGFMQSLAQEVGDDGIKVSTIVPGSIRSDFGGRSSTDRRANRDDGKKYLVPEDVAAAVVFLLGQPRHAWTQELNLWPF
jgi:3-oxoacyl-[acyl-carrier protein] reductase